jgi:predicted dehydrogenase
MSSNFEILIVGTGMYVCGRGTDGFGTVLPAIYEWYKENEITKLHIAGTSPESIKQLKRKQSEIECLFGSNIKSEYYPAGRPDNKAYLTAAEEISDPCCAMVVVPDHLHYNITADLIRRQIHPLVVKPLAPTVDEVADLIELKNEFDVHAAVEFHKRFDRSNRILRDAYKTRELGDPLYFLVQYSQRKSIPTEQFEKWVGRTNIFQYLGPHYVDIIYYITGAKPIQANVGSQMGYISDRGKETYDAIEAMIEWEDDHGRKFQSCFLVNWVDPESTSAMSDQRISLVGTNGRFEANQKRRGLRKVTDSKGIEEPNPDFCMPYGEPGLDSFGYEGYGIDSFHRFMNDVRRMYNGNFEGFNDDNRVVSFEDAKISTAVVEAVNECIKENKNNISIQI